MMFQESSLTTDANDYSENFGDFTDTIYQHVIFWFVFVVWTTRIQLNMITKNKNKKKL